MAIANDPFFKSSNAALQSKRKRPNRQTSLASSKKSSQAKSKNSTEGHRRATAKKKNSRDEELEESGDDDGLSVDLDAQSGPESVEEEDENETPAQKRLRLAQGYLQDLQRSQQRDEGTFDAAEIDKEIIASRLQQDHLETTGKLYSFLGEKLKNSFSNTSLSLYRFKTGKNYHARPVTCVKLNKNGSRLYVSDKQGKIIQYDCAKIWTFSSAQDGVEEAIQTGYIQSQRVMQNYVPPKRSDLEKYQKKQESKQHKTLSTARADEQKGHIGEVLTIDVTEDEKILASGGTDKLIGVWDLTNDCTNEWKVGLRGHKDVIASLSFQAGTPTLFSASFDRMIKVFNLESLTYSETLFGHQDRIHSISALRNEVLVSAGGRDRTCRYWKIMDETQLVFRGGGSSKIRDLIDGVGLDAEDQGPLQESKRKRKTDSLPNYVEGSIDCVCMIDDKMFLSGGDSGSISLWTTSKKKAVFTQALAHGTQTHIISGTTEALTQPRWVTSLHCVPYSDLFFSGSWDGVVRIWRLLTGERGNEIRSFENIGQVDLGPKVGVVNSLHAILRTTDNSDKLKSERPPNKNGEKDRRAEKQLAIAIGIGQEHRVARHEAMQPLRLKRIRKCRISLITKLGFNLVER
ncbi:hypothetical protein O181_055415 [Austropuccinia psidii MF-1]|uniref:U3 small nucleolar RNA-interacting protein 2 n=1 Tax=Austropuccinia psidii MF-1 TaxID=1389203 RepID=A0A9Q3E495_9BASI|nr:hypothetical protein [Austropuccinia psidii MF-1]